MLLAALCAVAVVVPVPYVVMKPGPTFDTIGTLDGKDLVHVAGTQTFPTTGALRMTTVREYGGPGDGVALWEAVTAWLSRDSRVLPREAMFPDGTTVEDSTRQGAEQFSTSQSDAIAAALHYLKLPVVEKVVVSDVLDAGPAHGLIHAGDQVVSIDGVAMTTPEQVVAAVRSRPVGSTLHFTVLRNGATVKVDVVSGSRKDDPTTPANEDGLPYIGAGVDVLYSATFTVSFDVDGVGGPSAGTMFALAIVDKLTPGALTGGKDIAGTGTIAADGTVGTIGGIAQKMNGAREAGAVLFLAPAGNCDEVTGHIPAGLTVTPISTLSDAVAAVQKFAAGQALPSCTTK
jgi:PDZ domain-containing protein